MEYGIVWRWHWKIVVATLSVLHLLNPRPLTESANGAKLRGLGVSWSMVLCGDGTGK
jgi:hypothetical protein